MGWVATEPRRLGGPHRFRAGGRIIGGLQLGKVAAQPLRPSGSPPLQSGWQNHRWPTSGQGGYITPAAWGVPTTSERCGRIRVSPQVARVATKPLPPSRSPPLQSGGQIKRWPTSGQGGYITHAALGNPTASERGADSEVAHKWARWLHNPCRLGGPHHFRAVWQNQSQPTSGPGGYKTLAAWGNPTASERGAN